jgi:hypothetical protein
MEGLDGGLLDLPVHPLGLTIGSSMASRPSIRFLKGWQAGACSMPPDQVRDRLSPVSAGWIWQANMAAT